VDAKLGHAARNAAPKPRKLSSPARSASQIGNAQAARQRARASAIRRLRIDFDCHFFIHSDSLSKLGRFVESAVAEG